MRASQEKITAVGALEQKLICIMFAVLGDGAKFDPQLLRTGTVQAVVLAL